MKLSLDKPDFACPIRAYAPGRVTVGEEVLTRSAVVLPERILRDWPPRSFEELEADHLLGLSGLGVEVLLLGTGERLRFPDHRTVAALTARGIGVEVMDTAAACRTFNILAGEGRRVAAALIIG